MSRILIVEDEFFIAEDLSASLNEMVAYDKIDDFYRSYYIYPLHKLNTSSSKSLMAKLKKSKEESIKKEVEQVLKY